MNEIKIIAPLIFNCYFSGPQKELVRHRYKIDDSHLAEHPFQLFKWNEVEEHWENLSVYASVDDALRILLKGLLSKDLIEEVEHGQATVDPSQIVEKIKQGEQSISIFESANDKGFRLDADLPFEDLVHRKLSE